jgi:predicted ester cyclase
MLKSIKKVSLKISMVAALAVAPVALQAGAMEGLTESTSAGLEAPNFEHQLVRINTGINFTRLSHDIMNEMPISADAEWVDKTVANMDMDMMKATIALDEVRNDAYFSTAPITNLILRRPVVSMSPAILRLYYVASVMYKNKSNSYVLDADGQQIMGKDGKPKQNGYEKFHMPDFNEFPDVTNLETYAKFKENKQVALIDVEAKNGNIHVNVQAAIIALLPDDLQDRAKLALEEKNVVLVDFQKSRANVALLESWLDDENHANDPDIVNKKKGLALAEAKNEQLEEEYNKKKNIYLAILDQGALHIEANFDASKVPLAKKVEKLLELVDDGAINAISLFGAAAIGIYRGYGEVDKEMKAILAAQALTTLVGNQKQFLIERYKRMIIGAVMAIPNVSVGTYYVIAGRGTISTYKDVVGAVVEGAEVQAEAQAEAEATAKAIEAQEQAEAPSTETK